MNLLPIDDILKAAATAHGTSVAEMRGHWNYRNIIKARIQAAEELSRLPVKLRHTQIGWILNKQADTIHRYLNPAYRAWHNARTKRQAAQRRAANRAAEARAWNAKAKQDRSEARDAR